MAFFRSFLMLSMLSLLPCLFQAQELKKAERDLLETYGKLLCFNRAGNPDMVEMQSDIFTTNFKTYLQRNPSSLVYPFQSLLDSGYCYIQTSADSLFRIYSWDTYTGGTMHFFHTLYQYKAGDKVYVRERNLAEGEPGSFYSELHTLYAADGTYYLGISNSIFSTSDVSQTIKIFSIESQELNDTVRIIKPKANRLINQISVNYNFFSVVDRPERPVRLIKYDDQFLRIYIPIVLDEGKVSNRFIIYEFTGRYFEKILTQKKASSGK